VEKTTIIIEGVETSLFIFDPPKEQKCPEPKLPIKQGSSNEFKIDSPDL
jgi:hypothetical protein